MNKYRNKKVTIDGHTFDSTKEGQRYQQLKLLLRANKISDLQLQPKFTLQDGFKTPWGKTIRAITYIADFAYRNERGEQIIEDVKGVRTKEYLLKRKMMAKLGIKITET
jgi:hypothetical protein